MPLPKTVTAEEIAGQLNVTREWVYKAGRDGTLPGMVRAGRRVLFLEDAVDAWIRNGGAALPHGWRKAAAQ